MPPLTGSHGSATVCVSFHEKSANEFFVVSTEILDLTFLPLLYTWTDASILSCVKMLSYAEDLIPDICGQHLNDSELHKSKC